MITIQDILKQIKGRTEITYEELNDMLPKGTISEEVIDMVLEYIDKKNIRIIRHPLYIRKNVNKYNETIIMDNLINTPDKFYFYELNKNTKLKEDKEKQLFDELSHIKDKIKGLIIETEFFEFKLFKDIINIKNPKNTNFIFFNSTQEITTILIHIKDLFKKYTSNKKITSNQIEMVSYLQKVNFKFTYILEKVSQLKKIYSKIENKKDNKTKEDILLKREKVSPHLLKNTFPELEYLLKQYDEIKKRLAKSQLPLVLSIVKHYFQKRINHNDLIQEGNIALLEALDYYYPGVHQKEFKQFFSSWVRDKVKDFMSHNNSLASITKNFKKDCRIFIKTYNKLRNDLMRPPHHEELRKSLNWPEDKIIKIINYLKQEESLEDEVIDKKITLKNALFNKKQKLPEDMAIEKILKEQIIEIVNQLPEKESLIIKMRFGFNPDNRVYEYNEIAQLTKTTISDVKNIEEIALKKLRIMFKKNNMEEFID